MGGLGSPPALQRGESGAAGGLAVSVLPLIDLLILMGTGSVMVGFVLKAIALTTHYRPSVFGFHAMDFALFTLLALGLALTLAARTWVKLNEPLLLTMKRYGEAGRQRVREQELGTEEEGDLRSALAAVRSQTAGADRR